METQYNPTGSSICHPLITLKILCFSTSLANALTFSLPPTHPCMDLLLHRDLWCLFTSSSGIAPLFAHTHREAVMKESPPLVTSFTSDSWRKQRRWRSWRCQCQPWLSWRPGNCWGSSAPALWGKQRSSWHSDRSPSDLGMKHKTIETEQVLTADCTDGGSAPRVTCSRKNSKHTPVSHL